MKILTKENALELLGGESLDTFVSELSSRLCLVGDTYSIPRDAGRKTALSRVFAYLLLRKSSVCVYVTGWGVWGSSENLDLFYGYRRSFGENRPGAPHIRGFRMCGIPRNNWGRPRRDLAVMAIHSHSFQCQE